MYNEALNTCPVDAVADRSILYSNRGMVQLARQRDGDYYGCVRVGFGFVLKPY